MLQRFYPDEKVDSVKWVFFDELYKRGYRGIIFDVDNTLVPHGAPADDASVRLFERLRKEGMKSVILSNNKEERVKSFAQSVSSPYVYKAGKPGRKGYERAMRMMGTFPENTVCVGDQIFTDIWGAKRLGILTYLVDPIDEKEEFQIVIKRHFENIVLYHYYMAMRNRMFKGEK